MRTSADSGSPPTEGSYLGLHVVGHVVDGAPQRDLPHGPRSVVGQVGGQDADPQLPLWEPRGTCHFLWRRRSLAVAHLFVEVEEAFGAVDVMEGGEGLDGAVDGHGVQPHGSSGRDEHPVGRGSADEHLREHGRR